MCVIKDWIQLGLCHRRRFNNVLTSMVCVHRIITAKSLSQTEDYCWKLFGSFPENENWEICFIYFPLFAILSSRAFSQQKNFPIIIFKTKRRAERNCWVKSERLTILSRGWKHRCQYNNDFGIYGWKLQMVNISGWFV